VLPANPRVASCRQRCVAISPASPASAERPTVIASRFSERTWYPGTTGTRPHPASRRPVEASPLATRHCGMLMRNFARRPARTSAGGNSRASSSDVADPLI
jgi:hypothetical protein